MTASMRVRARRSGLAGHAAVLAVILAVASGCTSSDASEDAASGSDGVATTSAVDALDHGGEPAQPGDPPGTGPMRSRTGGGTEVVLRRVEPDSGPLVAGPVRWRIETSLPLERAPTVDLVSPEMPMHGIVRYPSTASDADGWDVETPIPMEGRWHLYVNVDDGADAAEFILDALPGEAGGHEHGSEAGEMPMTHH